MFSFGQGSRKQLKTCHPSIRRLLNEAIKYIDFSVLCGGRGCVKQMEYYNSTPQRSQKVYPDSKHNPDWNSFNPEELGAILQCKPEKSDIQEKIKTAQLDQLRKIDEIAEKKASRAVDIIPWKPNRPHIRWDWEKQLFESIIEAGNLKHSIPKQTKNILYNIEEWTFFLGIIRGIAFIEAIPIRLGFDWNQNGLRGDQGLDDCPHLELI